MKLSLAYIDRNLGKLNRHFFSKNESSTLKKYLIIALCLPFLVSFGRLASGGFDLTYFIGAGEYLVLKQKLVYPLKVIKDSRGYDGISYYQLALDPTNRDHHAFGLMSNLAYRKQRILYPVLSHLLSFGNPHWVPGAMIMVNLLAISFSILIAYKLIVAYNSYPIYILLFAGLIGSHIALTKNLAETLEGFFLTLIAYFFIKKKYFLIFLASCGALFTRETSVLIVGPLSIILLFALYKEKKLFSLNALLACLPILLIVTWKIYIYLDLGGHHVGDIQSIPFKGMLSSQVLGFKNFWYTSNDDQYAFLIYYVYNIVFTLWIFYTLIKALSKIKIKNDNWNLWIAISLLVSLVFALFLSESIYRSDLSYGRVFNGILILTVLFLIVRRQKVQPLYLLSTFTLYAFAYGRLIFLD
ncbi:MAG: hypothetical protein V3V00_13345 [Saprospiraceae bacterium]